VFSKPSNCKSHASKCLSRIEFIEELIRQSDDPLTLEDNAPTEELQDDVVAQYSNSDGKDDLRLWEMREVEEDRSRRDAVVIEADVLKFDWKELARI
jgi:hypothetical protein